MKLKTLTITNFASIESACIDFEQQPLSTTDVFLITGKTGSGKSTILDAICLALFKKVPRLENTDIQGDSPYDGDSLTQKDPRQFLSRGKGEGGVELLFEGSNKILYKARYWITKAHRKPTGRLQSKEWELTNMATGTMLNRDREVEAEMSLATGMTFTQFCSAVMLPQGAFTNFLESNDKDKAEILEKITGMEIYSRIGAQIYEITSQKEAQYQSAANEMNGIVLMDENQRQEAQRQQDDFQESLRQLNVGRAELQRKVDWIKAEEQLLKASASAQAELESATAAVSTDEFKALERRHALWQATIEVRASLQRRLEAQQVLDECDRQIEGQTQEWLRLRGGQLWAQQKLDQQESELGQVKARLEAMEGQRLSIENVQTIISDLQNKYKELKRIERAKSDIEANDKRIKEELTPLRDQLLLKWHQAQAELKKQRELCQQLDREFKVLGLSDLRTQLQNLVAEQGELGKGILMVNQYLSDLSDLAAMREKHSMMQQDLVLNQAKTQDLQNAMMVAKQTASAIEEEWELQKETIDQWAKAMRAKLKEGDVCPVCHQKLVHQLPHEDELDALVAGLKNKLQEAKAKSDNATEAYTNHMLAIKNLESGCADETQAISSKEGLLSQQQTMVLEFCSRWGVETLDETTPRLLQSCLEEKRESQNSLNELLRQGEAKEKSANTEQAKIPQLVEQENSAKMAYHDAVNAIDGLLSKNAIYNQNIAGANENIQALDEHLSPLIDVAQWQHSWLSEMTDFANELKQVAQQYNLLRSQEGSLEKTIGNQRLSLDNLKSDFEALQLMMPMWNNLPQPQPAEVIGIEEGVQQLSQRTVGTQTQKSNAASQLEQAGNAVKAYLEAHPETTEKDLLALQQISSAQHILHGQQLQDTLARKSAAQNASQECAKKLEDHLGQKPEIAEGETLVTLEESVTEITAKESEINQLLGALNQRLKDDQEKHQQKGGLEAQVNVLKAEFDRWSRLNQMIGSKHGDEFRKIAQSYVLANLVHSANYYMRTLSDRYQLRVEPGSFVIMVEDAFQGFASRSASTISGGEKFLVSLALALALVDIGDGLSVDTLFIDEGFGTLSGEPLQSAIATLRRLYSKTGRRVGIISHIEEVRERIPIQIQVIQEGNSSSSTVKVCRL